jgi:DNA-binding NtrC family response regulator
VPRKATPAELARLSGDGARQIPAWPSPADRAAVRANREAARIVERIAIEARRISREAARAALRAAKRPAHRPPLVPTVDVMDAVRACNGNRAEAARRLGMDSSAIYHRLRRNPVPADVSELVAAREYRR